MASEYDQLIKTLTERFAKKKSEAESGAIGEAIRRGGTGGSLEAGLRQKAITPIEEAEGSAISGIMAQLADREREERLIKEGRGFTTSEREARQGYGTSERIGGQEFGTSERVGTQEYGTTERIGGQEYGTSERVGRQEYGTSERKGSQEYGTSERVGRESFASKQQQQDALNRAIMEGYVAPGTTSFSDTTAWTPYSSGIGSKEEQAKKWYGRAGARERQHEQNYGTQLAIADFNRPKSKDKRKWWEGAVEGIASGVGTGVGMGATTLLMSDKRAKKDIKDVGPRLKEFKYKKDVAEKFNLPKGKQWGFIAQDIEKVKPEAIGKIGEYKAIDYSKLL